VTLKQIHGKLIKRPNREVTKGFVLVMGLGWVEAGLDLDPSSVGSGLWLKNNRSIDKILQRHLNLC